MRRPVPLIGDTSSAAQRAGDPRGWAMPPEVRDALSSVVAARRDIRRFRPDPVPAAALQRVLAAGHAGPSVGHSQPWRFVVVTDPATRDRAAMLADAGRLAQASLLDADAGRRLRDLQLEGIREAPLGVVVCCDRRADHRGVLGRATFPDADLWSCACAIQNIWLTARAEGLGVGWVTLFRPQDLADLIALPDGVQTLGWLCLGWPDERPPAPGLQRAGWSRRAPLADVVMAERWPGDDSAPPPSWLRAPDRDAVVGVRDDADTLLTPPRSLGALDVALDRVLALRRGDAADTGAGTLVFVGADHPVTYRRISAYPTTVTADVLTAAAGGTAAGTVAAAHAGLRSVVVDAGVGLPDAPCTWPPGTVSLRPTDARGDLVDADALTAADARRLTEGGRRLGARLGAAGGPIVLGEVGVGNTTVASALAAALLGDGSDESGMDGADPADDDFVARLVGLGSGSDSAMVGRKVRVVSAAVRRARNAYGTDLDDPDVVLRALGGGEFAVLTGVVLGAVEAGVPVVLDGLATGVCALLAARREPAAAAHLVAGQRSGERAHAEVLTALGLEPLLDLRLRAGEGVGAVLALGLLTDAVAIRRHTARTEPSC